MTASLRILGGAAALTCAVFTGCSSAPTPVGSPTEEAALLTSPASTTSSPQRTTPSQGGNQTPAFTPGRGATVPTLTSPPATVRATVGGPPATSGATRVQVTAMRRDIVQGFGPGEISGPAVVFTVVVRNDSASPVSLSSAVATAQIGGRPAAPFAGPPATGWGDVLAAHAARTVTLAFAAPTTSALVELMVSIDPSAAPLTFSATLAAA